ncbi:Ran GAP Rna1 [Mucor velutinosus]|uniref:Ran GAP Rna1 n=1 Tax=Mucor velutinosus TaxID=708070 RepID=A0AAN7DPU0_9FUNG|nr:Ran GAP Rna1 [Mucor velutinosus]
MKNKQPSSLYCHFADIMYFDEIISNEWNISTALDLYSVEYPDAATLLRAIKSDLKRISKNPNVLKSAREKAESLLDKWNDVKKKQKGKEHGESSTVKAAKAAKAAKPSAASTTTYNNSNHFTTSGDHSNIIVGGSHSGKLKL